MRKDEYPKAIADLLDIPRVWGRGGPWVSTEGTVLTEWLMAIGEALDVPYMAPKTLMMQRLVAAVGGDWDEGGMTSLMTRSQGGGNIRKEAFVALLAGLHNLPVLRAATLKARAEAFDGEDDPGATADRTVYRAIRERAGQPRFRAGLLEVYDGRCAVTACDAPSVLEAAHVIPYGAGGTYDLRNGLLLRADIHTLFDKGMLAFSDDRSVVLHTDLTGTQYADLAGIELANPTPTDCMVPTERLAWHRAQAGL